MGDTAQINKFQESRASSQKAGDTGLGLEQLTHRGPPTGSDKLRGRELSVFVGKSKDPSHLVPAAEATAKNRMSCS